MFFVQFSCQKEDLIPLTSLDEKGFGEEISIRTLYADDLENIPLLQKEWMKMDFSEKNLHTIHTKIPEQRTLSVTESNISQFEIDYSLAKEISYHSIITYTFQLKDVNNIVSNKLINLLYIKYPEEERMRRIVVVYHKDGNGRDTGNDLEFIISTHSILENGDIYPPIDSEDYPKTTYGGIRLDEVVIIGTPPGIDDIEFPWDDDLLDHIFPGNPGGGEGGGGNGNNIPTIPVENIKTPCEMLNELFANNILNTLLKDLLEKRTDSIEHGITYNTDGTFIYGTNGTPNSVDHTIRKKSEGTAHTHTDGLDDVFSVPDFFSFITLLNHTDTPFNDNFSIVMGSNYAYMLTFEGTDSDFLSLFGNNNSPFNPNTVKDLESSERFYEGYEKMKYNQEETFIHIINNHYLKDGFSLENLKIKLVRFKLSKVENPVTEGEEITLNENGKSKSKKC